MLSNFGTFIMNADRPKKVDRPRVLVVDDEALIRWSLTERLQDDGWEVGTASVLATARRQLSNGTWDLLICDVKLPDGLGLELLDELRDLPHPPAVLVITAHGDATMRTSALAKGALALVDKPFDLDALAAQAAAIVSPGR